MGITIPFPHKGSNLTSVHCWMAFSSLHQLPSLEAEKPQPTSQGDFVEKIRSQNTITVTEIKKQVGCVKTIRSGWLVQIEALGSRNNLAS